jgi:hypothetical protein
MLARVVRPGLRPTKLNCQPVSITGELQLGRRLDTCCIS